MKAERKVFGRLQNVYDPPDLIEIQTKSYNDFLQEDVPPAQRKEKGLQAIVHEIFPIESYDGRYVLDFLSYEFEEFWRLIEDRPNCNIVIPYVTRVAQEIAIALERMAR